ncbi:MAG: SusC/RagA family TonB-linked outer membrane protein [Flavobacteriaceae bacterium]|nr:SusC/RagA family TonB-linked outer membrane protein [Flavobacteriaceae bacterium]
MRTNIKLLVTSIFLAGSIFAWAQQKTITGQVTDSDGFPVADAYVYVQGTDNGVYTDANGNYTLSVNQGDTVAVEFIGFDSSSIAVGNANNYNLELSKGGSVDLGTTVATALGIEREKKALGYAVQEVDGDMLNASKSNNALSSLSGNVAGVQISTPSGNMGGSARVLLRGAASVTQENRPLIVVDGIPMSNDNFNSVNTQRGAGGRDYGDNSFDIDPNNIEKVSVLKGGAASALYGSRGMNGVILITTKSGRKGVDQVEINSGVSFESISLFPKLQRLYGGGSSDTFEQVDINGNTYNIVEYSMDESWGPRYDPNISVLHWDAFDPEFPNDYLRPRPWVAPENDAKTFFQTGVTYNNSIAFSKSFDNSVMRMSYSNLYVDGMFPNSKLTRNSVNLGINSKFSEKLTVSGDLTYVNNNAFNRPEVGYGDNSVIQKMLQWGQRQLDYGRLRNYILPNGSQRTWNRRGWDNGEPLYSDNPYWTAYMNTAEDERNRFYGNLKLRYNITNHLYAMGNIYGDGYAMTGSERVAIGSQAQSEYSQVNRNARELNYETRLHYDRDYGTISVNSFIGGNIRDEYYKSVLANTEGGLIAPGIYNLGNSTDTPTVTNFLRQRRVNSLLGLLSIGFNDIFFVEGTARNDWSSTLPAHNNSYFYPSVSGSFVFSELIKENWLRFGKIRAGWARSGNDTDAYQLLNTFVSGGTFNGAPTFTLTTTNKNNELVAENVDSWEVGLEMSMFKGRFGFDVTYYDQKSSQLLMPVQISSTTGFSATAENSADMRNKGIEALVYASPLKTQDFSWDITWNFAKNDNMVEGLLEGIDALRLTNAPFNIQLWAVAGKKYGQLRGFDFVYDNAGNKVILPNGRYARTAQVQDLGSVLPDYNMGLRNTIRYKNLALSFLIDMQKGGKYFSTSNMWGMYSGMLEETAANGIRENGIVMDGVQGTITYDQNGNYTVTDTSPNDVNIPAFIWGAWYYSGPHSQNVFDADYFKLRDVTLTYSFPQNFLGPFKGVDVSLFGRNLLTWGLDNKNFDPEMATSGSGNIQGLEGGSLPPTRTYGMNLKLQF